jgi:hypothetical protein
MQLTQRQQNAIDDATKAMRQTLKAAYPEDFPVLFVAAVTGMFASLIRGELGSQLMNVVNEELKAGNLVLTRRTGFGSPHNPAVKARAVRANAHRT